MDMILTEACLNESWQESSLSASYMYDYWNSITSMTNENDSGVISGYISEYLLNGQKSEETVTVMDEEEENSTKTVSYTYDSNNNRREMTSGNWATFYKYNKNAELLCTDTLNTNTIVMSFLLGCTIMFFERRCRKAVYEICSIFSLFLLFEFPGNFI